MPLVNFIPENRHCNNREHDPPQDIFTDPGQYTWQCPECGEQSDHVVSNREFTQNRCGTVSMPPTPQLYRNGTVRT